MSFEYHKMTSMLMCHQEGGKRSSTFLNMQILSSQMVLCQTVSKCLLWTENNFMSREFIQSYKPLKTCGYNEVHHYMQLNCCYSHDVVNSNKKQHLADNLLSN